MKIAIKANPSRGKEIISLLESLAGNNIRWEGDATTRTYYIDINNMIQYGDAPKDYKVYTLEEFEKEFPFKIGDKVKHITSIGIIKEYCYINNEPAYKVESMELGIIATIPAKILEPYKEMEERNITLTLDKAKEWYKKGGELKEIALQAFTEKELTKLDLPKTWEEFCENYPVQTKECWLSGRGMIEQPACSGSRRYKNWIPSRKSAEAHLAMIQLEQLRDCYRGLFITVIGMPIWNISIYDGKPHIFQAIWGKNQSFLSFQSKEVAEEYLKNFKPLIEKAGDLI